MEDLHQFCEATPERRTNGGDGVGEELKRGALLGLPRDGGKDVIPQSLPNRQVLDERNSRLRQHLLGPNSTREQDVRTSKRSKREDDLLVGSDVPPRSVLGLTDFDADDTGPFEDEASDGRSGEDLEVRTRVDVLGEVARRGRAALARRRDVREEASDLRAF